MHLTRPTKQRCVYFEIFSICKEKNLNFKKTLLGSAVS